MSLCWGGRVGRGWQLEAKTRGWSAVRGQEWHPALKIQPAGSWVWHGPRVPKGEFRVQSAALAAQGLIQSTPASAGASDVAAFGFGFSSVSLTHIAETFSPHTPQYSSVFPHLASGSAEIRYAIRARKHLLSGIYKRCALETSSVFATVLRGPGNQTLLKCLERYGRAQSP